jgi:hypothetical protein
MKMILVVLRAGHLDHRALLHAAIALDGVGRPTASSATAGSEVPDAEVGAPAYPPGLRCGREPAAGRGPSTWLSGRPNRLLAAAIPLARRCNGP